MPRQWSARAASPRLGWPGWSAASKLSLGLTRRDRLAPPSSASPPEFDIAHDRPALRAWLPAVVAAATLTALLVWNHHLQRRLGALEARATQADEGPPPRIGWNMHMMGNLETFLDVNPLDPDRVAQLRTLTAESMQVSTLIQRRFEDHRIDCFQRLVETKAMLEHHEQQAATLLDPEQMEDYLDIVCPTGQRGCMAYELRDMDLVELLDR